MRFGFIQYLRRLVDISHSHHIARRYFVVNGFDGALTTLGLLVGFYISRPQNLQVAITACIGAAVALTMSGISSAYISEAAERKREFDKLQVAMITDLKGTAHDEAARWMPILIAIVNGASPLILSLLIISPLWLIQKGVILPWGPYLSAISVALVLIFLLGVFLGNISGTFWLLSGFKAVLIALITSGLIILVA